MNQTAIFAPLLAVMLLTASGAVVTDVSSATAKVGLSEHRTNARANQVCLMSGT